MYTETLCAAIINRALADYEKLFFTNSDCIDDCGQTIRRKELEDFFNSEWSDFLLSSFGMTGKEAFSLMVRKWSNGNRYFSKNTESISKEIKRTDAATRKSGH